MCDRCEMARSLLENWANKQGHERCWWHPDILTALANALDVKIPPPILPLQAEFSKGCDIYKAEQYEKRSSS